MKSTLRTRFWLELGLAALCGFLAVLTVFSRDWVEALSGFDPDHRNGAFEWAVVAALAAICVVAGTAARSEWRRPTPAVAAGS